MPPARRSGSAGSSAQQRLAAGEAQLSHAEPTAIRAIRASSSSDASCARGSHSMFSSGMQ